MSETSLAMDPTASGSQPKPSPPTHDPEPAEDRNTAETGARTEDAGAKQRRRANRKRPDVPQLPFVWDMHFERKKVYTQEEKAEAWSKADGMVQEYSDEMISRWKEEIDTYLVFAGLFSAVLTTFNVQTYVLLQPPAPDASMAVLLQISSQLASFSIAPPFVNSTQLSSTNILDSSNAPPIPRWALWLNALWFSGLILSLAAASIGILVKQWLNEYSSGLSGKSGAGASGSGVSGSRTSRAVGRVRQYRLENLRTWRVEDIVGTIPILLQIALAFFLAGMLILLWSLHHTVAAIASVLVGLLATFTIVATLLPLCDHRCSYLTPQIRALNALWQPKWFAYWSCAHISAGLCTAARLFSSPSNNLPFEPRPHRHFEYVRRQLTAWVMPPLSVLFRRVGNATRRPEAWKERKQTWQGRERSAIGDLARVLDVQTLVQAYSSTLHPDALSTASVCLMDLEANFVLDYFRKLHTSAREHFGPAADSDRSPLGLGMQQQMLWLQVLLCIVTGGDPPLSEEETAVLGTYFRWGYWSSSMKDRHAEWAIKALDSLFDQERTEVRRLGFLDLDTLYSERSGLVRHVIDRKEPFVTSIMPTVSGAYYHVRLSQSGLSQASSDDRRAAYSGYLLRVANFLEHAAIALGSSIPPTDLENVRTCVQDVLIELTGDLRDVLTPGRVVTDIASTDLCNVLPRFQELNDSAIEDCIPDDFVPDMLQLMDLLSTYSDYDDDFYVEAIQENARRFKDTLIRVKGDPGRRKSVTFETLPAAAPSEDTPSEVANPSGLSVRSSGGQTLPSSPTIPSAADSSHDGALTETPPVDLAA